MLKMRSKFKPHYSAMSVFNATLTDEELLHTAVKDVKIPNGVVKSIAIYDSTLIVVMDVERRGRPRKYLFWSIHRPLRSQITLRLIKLPRKKGMYELIFSISPVLPDKISRYLQAGHDLNSEDWVQSVQSKISENISRAGGRTCQTFPATQA